MKENLESIGNINQLADEGATFAGFLKNDEFYRNLSEKMEGFGKDVEKFGMIVGVADVIRAKL